MILTPLSLSKHYHTPIGFKVKQVFSKYYLLLFISCCTWYSFNQPHVSKLNLMIANLQAMSVNFICLFLDQDREQGTAHQLIYPSSSKAEEQTTRQKQTQLRFFSLCGRQQSLLIKQYVVICSSLHELEINKHNYKVGKKNWSLVYSNKESES